MSALEHAASDAASPILSPQGQHADPALDMAWDAYRRWDWALIARKRRVDWSRRIIFIMLVSAAVAGVLASQLHSMLAAAIAAVFGAVAALLKSRGGGARSRTVMAERPRGSRNLEVGSIQICGRGGPHNEAERGRRLIAAVAAIQADNRHGSRPEGCPRARPHDTARGAEPGRIPRFPARGPAALVRGQSRSLQQPRPGLACRGAGLGAGRRGHKRNCRCGRRNDFFGRMGRGHRHAWRNCRGACCRVAIFLSGADL